MKFIHVILCMYAHIRTHTNKCMLYFHIITFNTRATYLSGAVLFYLIIEKKTIYVNLKHF